MGYSIIAPDAFNNVQQMSDVPITDEEKAKGRVIEVYTMFDIIKGDILPNHQLQALFSN